MNLFHMDSPFARFMNRLVDIVVIGIITLVCCIPIVTVGAAITSLYYVTLKMVRRSDGNILHQYFRAFKQNFRQATALWGIMAAVIAVLWLDYNLLYGLELSFEGIQWILLFIITVLAAMVGSYIFPLQAQFENPVRQTLKNAFILSIMNLPRSILILLVKLSPLLVLFIYPEVMYILGIFCLAGIPYLCTELIVKIFDKYMPEEKEDELSVEEADDALVSAPVSSGEDEE